MMAFFFTMPISRMMPISAMTFSSHVEEQQGQQRAGACRGQRRQNGDGMNVALVQHAQHDVDGHQGGEDQDRLEESESWKAAAVPWKLPWMVAGMPHLAARRR